MEDNDIYEILKFILIKIKDKKFTWRLEGSANLKIQGIDISVRDLDIATNKEGINIFRKLLREFIIEDYYKEEIKAESLICSIINSEVEVLNRNPDDKGLNMFNKIKIIKWKELQIPILPLEYALEFYKIIDKQDKVELIENHLQKK